MSYVSDFLGERRVNDADGHLMEMPEWLASFADEKTRRLLKPFNCLGTEQGVGEDWHPNFFSSHPTSERTAAAEEQFMMSKNYASLGGVEPSERGRALDLLGVEKQFIFATGSTAQFDLRSIGQEMESLDLLYGGSQAHNRGMAAFCSHDSRMVGTGYVPLEDPQRALATLEEALKLGCGAILIPSTILQERSWSHPDYDPLWARIEEAGTPILLHVGTGDMSLGLPKAVYNNGRPPSYTLGEGSWQLPDLITWHWTAELMLSALVIDGVFERFPGLRCGVIELRAHWVPSLLTRLDFMYEATMGVMPDRVLPMRASDYIRRQVKFTPWCMGGDPLAAMIQTVEGGDELFMFSSDDPHPEGGIDPITAFESEIGQLPEGVQADVREKFYYQNFADLMGRS